MWCTNPVAKILCMCQVLDVSPPSKAGLELSLPALNLSLLCLSEEVYTLIPNAHFSLISTGISSIALVLHVCECMCEGVYVCVSVCSSTSFLIHSSAFFYTTS